MRVWFHENSFLGLKFVLLLHDFKIIKYFGMNDNQLIIDLISQTNLLKNIVPMQRFHEKNGYFHIR